MRWRLVVALVTAAAFAGWRLESSLEQAAVALSAAIGQDVQVEGVIVSEPDPGELTTAYDVRAVRVLLADGPVLENAGTIRVWLHQYERYLPGDRLLLEGKLSQVPTFETFDYRSYLASRGIYATMWRPKTQFIGKGSGPARELTRLRLALDRSLQRSLPEPAASLAAGIAFGRDGGFSQEMRGQFNESGLRHLVAVSGANLVLVAAMTLAVGSRLVGRRRAWPAAASAVAVYVALAGFEPSVARAAVMTAVLFAGELVGRPQSGLPGLAAAIMLLTATWPRIALDPGLQLSAAATAGLITIGPWLRFGFEAARRWWLASWVPGWATDVAALSLAASITTAPITWAHFGSVSIIGPIANVFVQPVVAAAFWASVGVAALGIVWQAAAEVGGLAAYYPLSFIVDCAALFSRPPWATVGSAGASDTVAAAAGAALALAGAVAYRFLPPTVELSESAHERARLGSLLILGGATAGLAIAVASTTFDRRDALTVDILDVGQGDAILLTTPGGKQVLVDAGPSDLRLARELGQTMPPWDRTVELVVVSHPQEDHIGGLPGLGLRYRVRTVVSNGDSNTTRTGTLVTDIFGRQTLVARAGDRFEVDGVTFDVLWPPAELTTDDSNRRSLVLLVSHDKWKVLLAGDLDAVGQAAVLPSIHGPVDVLKVPHHGSRDSDQAFLGLAAGGVAVISVGATNPYGHPHPSTLEALAGATVFRTDEGGRIRLVLGQGRLRFETER